MFACVFGDGFLDLSSFLTTFSLMTILILMFLVDKCESILVCLYAGPFCIFPVGIYIPCALNNMYGLVDDF